MQRFSSQLSLCRADGSSKVRSFGLLLMQHQKIFGASSKNIFRAPAENIFGHHQEIFLRCQLKMFLGGHWKYFKASAENIFGHPAEIFCPVWNNFYATRLTRCDRFGFGASTRMAYLLSWEIWNTRKFVIFIHILFIVAEFTKTVGFWNVAVHLQRVTIAAVCAICIC